MEPARPRMILAILFSLLFVSSSQFLVVSPILPRIAEALSVREDELGVLMGAYAVTVGVMALIAGPLSDRLGRRAILRAGSLVMAVSLLLHGFASDLTSLTVLRAISGLGSGMLAGAVTAYAGDVFPYEKRGAAMGVILSGMAFGQILGVPLGTVLAGAYGYQAPFVAVGAAMALGFVATVTSLPDAPVPAGSASTWAGAGAAYVSLLKRPDILAMCVTSVLMMLSVSTFMTFLPTWLEKTLHAESWVVPTMFLAGGVGNAIAGPLAGRMSDKVGRKGIILVSSGLLAVLMGLAPLLPEARVAVPAFFVTMGVAAMRIGPLNALLTALVDGAQRGALMALSMATGQIGFAVGTFASAWAFREHGFAACAGMAAASALIAAITVAVGLPEPDGASLARAP